MSDEIKEWQVQNNRLKVANLLMQDGVSFSYNEESGIVFSAPESYVKKLILCLMACYVCRVKSIINEYKVS